MVVNWCAGWVCNDVYGVKATGCGGGVCMVKDCVNLIMIINSTRIS